MLVLSRQIDDVLVIGDDITVRIVGIHNIDGPASKMQVRLGVEAPRDVQIDRLEIRQAKGRMNREYTSEGPSG